jgi:hypothetical protein
MIERVVGTRTLGGITQKIVRQEPTTCHVCGGEGVTFPEGLYVQYARMAENGTWLALAGDTDPKAKEVTHNNCLELLKSLAKVGDRYRKELLDQSRADAAKGDAPYPRGMLLFATTQETVDGPDGSYTLLDPGPGRIAVRTADWAQASDGQEKTPGADQGIVLVGVAVGPVSLAGQRAVYVEPFAWTRWPHLGGRSEKSSGPGESAAPSPVPAHPKKSKSPGEPNFFGL